MVSKHRQEYPAILQKANISSIYKRRGRKDLFESYRGIFNVVKVRSILDRLWYNSNYDKLDDNMSPSNIGARKGRNIRQKI